MKPVYRNGSVIAPCRGCANATTTFGPKDDTGRELGYHIVDGHTWFNMNNWSRVIYVLLRCATCGMGAVAKIHANDSVRAGSLESFLPMAVPPATIPEGVPEGIKSEFREAELCTGNGAYRAGSAMLRSVLEKTLRGYGYEGRNLEVKIDAAAADGILTDTLKKRAHQGRSLGNDVLHSGWRAVDESEFETAHTYTQRILEAFYDSPETVVELLIAKGRRPEGWTPLAEMDEETDLVQLENEAAARDPDLPT